ncbi:hypothetical protein [Magnetococcus sp. PR-3]|uniref:hypothetical protein n=1 Tax=Magnetococcus sp. PR-3 TaxID=3120355 RepID=UPI002FCDECEE
MAEAPEKRPNADQPPPKPQSMEQQIAQDPELAAAHAYHEARRKKANVSYLGDNNRRKGMDIILKSVAGLQTAGWGLYVAMLVFIHRGLPDFSTFFTQAYNVSKTAQYNTDIMGDATILALLIVVTSSIGLVLKNMRKKRSTDGLEKGLLFQVATSLLLALYLFAAF